jgi:hypothetical protein
MSQLGALAEWLRSGLQSRLHRFDSGRRLDVAQAEAVCHGILPGPVTLKRGIS